MKAGIAKKKTGTEKPKKEVRNRNLFENKKRTFGVGQSVQPKRDLTRFVRWPTYVLLQRKKRILYKRLKVPPLINQFTNTLPTDKAKALFKLLAKYKPEAKAQKKARLLEAAKNKTDKADEKKDKSKEKKDDSKKPKFLKCGLNHVTTLVEDKAAKLVIIANDVDPIELVMWLPHLCRSKDVPYCFIKSKARLGALVGKKSATCVAVTDLKKEDAADFEKLASSCRTLYNANKEHLTKYSDIVLGSRATARDNKAKLAKEAEVTAK